ncbi:hypothetical protein QUA27_25660 [Microcoleus sp. Pol14C6]|uniref:hypothetical protein n=1 Tax=unclassified Microcoleus TaxID=2642155 RepID=UPI002FD6890F
MKIKSDFKAVMFNENEPHTAKEWLLYWSNRNQLKTTEKTDLNLFMKDKGDRGLISDATFDKSGKCYIVI